MPKPVDVERVTIEPGSGTWHTPESLLMLLPRFVATEGLYLARKSPQRGTIVLKNGEVLRWIAIDNYSIELQSDEGIRLFVLPAECSLTAPEKGLALRPAGGRVFQHTGDISILNSSAGAAIALGYMPLEDARDRPNAPGLSAEFMCVDGQASTALSFKFWSTRRLKGQPLALIADGRSLERIILNSPTDAGLEDLGLIVYTINLPQKLFLKMVDAGAVKLLAGRETFTLSAEHLEALRDLASRMEGDVEVSQKPEEEPLFLIWDGRGKEGFMDARGNVVIAPRFDDVTHFSEGMAAVGIGDKWGYIDRTGKLVIPPRWKEVASFSEGVAAVVDSFHGYGHSSLDYSLTLKSCGYIDKTGRYVIEPSIERRMEKCPTFIEGLAPVCYDASLKLFIPDFADAGLCGFLDKRGQWAIKPQFVRDSQSALPSNFSEGLAPVGLRGSRDPATEIWTGDFAYIDETGRTVFELKGYRQAYPFRDGLARVVPGIEATGFIDRTGRLLFKFETSDVGDFSGGRALVRDPRTKRYGYIDKRGKWAIPPNYTRALPFSDGLASVCTEAQSQCAYIDTRGQVTIKMNRGGDSFHDGLALQYLHTRTIGPRPDFRNIYGYMNKSGKYVWVSPGGEYVFDDKWWRENYVGPPMPGVRRPNS
ncbi:MAG: WG repeat-containing protein [Rubrivivax sp.]|nr:WG repeat-containing protein [Pyrinomonadaceae bacterium]